MPTTDKRTSIDERVKDPAIAALQVEMAVRGWGVAELAAKLGVQADSLRNQFANEFSSKAMRQKINGAMEAEIFTEGVGV